MVINGFPAFQNGRIGSRRREKVFAVTLWLFYLLTALPFYTLPPALAKGISGAPVSNSWSLSPTVPRINPCPQARLILSHGAYLHWINLPRILATLVFSFFGDAGCWNVAGVPISQLGNCLAISRVPSCAGERIDAICGCCLLEIQKAIPKDGFCVAARPLLPGQLVPINYWFGGFRFRMGRKPKPRFRLSVALGQPELGYRGWTTGVAEAKLRLTALEGWSWRKPPPLDLICANAALRASCWSFICCIALGRRAHSVCFSFGWPNSSGFW